MIRAVMASVVVLVASAGLAERIEGTFVFPGVIPGTDLEGEYLAAGQPYVKECGLSEDEWKVATKGLTVHVREIRPSVYVIACEGEGSTGVKDDRLLDAMAKAHHYIWIQSFRTMRQARIHELEVKAVDARLKAEREEEMLNALYRSLEDPGDPRVALQASTQRIEELRSQAIRSGIEQEAIEAQIAAVRKLIETRRASKAEDGATESGARSSNPVLVRLEVRLVELEIDLVGLRARAAATKKVMTAEQAWVVELRKVLVRLDSLESRRDRYVEQTERLYRWLEEVVTEVEGDPSGQGPRRIAR